MKIHIGDKWIERLKIWKTIKIVVYCVGKEICREKEGTNECACVCESVTHLSSPYQHINQWHHQRCSVKLILLF